LLVSELATNALQHSASGCGGHFDVTILGGIGSALIAVTDQGSDKTPARGELKPEDETGRGLGLVELIAERWGQCGGRHGRTVWFELSWQTAKAGASLPGLLGSTVSLDLSGS
jgi:two-component sensor histidine kinase